MAAAADRRRCSSWRRGCAACCCRGAARRVAQSPDEAFLAALGELREASFPDKEAIVERLSAERPPERAAGARPRCSKTVCTSARRIRRSSSSSRPTRASPSLDAGRSGVARRRRRRRPGRSRRRSAPTTACGGCCGRRWRASTLSSPDPAVRLAAVSEMHALARRGEHRAAARSESAVETDAGVKDGDRDRAGAGRARQRRPQGAPRRDRDARRAGSGRKCATASPACSSNRRRHLRRERRGRQAGGRRARCARIDRVAHVLLRHRDAVLRAEPRLGAGAGRHRAGHHLRRHGRHQHGARRADDARRLHDLRRAARDAGPHRAVDPGGHSGGVSRGRRWRASSSSAPSSGFSTAGRSRRCSRPSASAWSCSSSCARSSRRTTARS